MRPSSEPLHPHNPASIGPLGPRTGVRGGSHRPPRVSRYRDTGPPAGSELTTAAAPAGPAPHAPAGQSAADSGSPSAGPSAASVNAPGTANARADSATSAGVTARMRSTCSSGGT